MRLHAYYIEREYFDGSADGLIMIWEADVMADTRAEMAARDMMRGNNYIERLRIYTDIRTLAEFARRSQTSPLETLYPE